MKYYLDIKNKFHTFVEQNKIMEIKITLSETEILNCDWYETSFNTNKINKILETFKNIFHERWCEGYIVCIINGRTDERLGSFYCNRFNNINSVKESITNIVEDILNDD